jgi:hypothetical protein
MSPRRIPHLLGATPPISFEAAHAGVGKWPEHFRKKTQGGPVLAAKQITTALFQRKAKESFSE